MTQTRPAPPRPVQRDSRPRQVGWRTRDILRAAALVAAVYVALQLLWVGRTVFFVGFFGVLLGITLSAGVDRLERWRVPRGVGALLLVLSGLGMLVGVGLLIAPRIGEQAQELRQQVPQAIDRVERWAQQRAGGLARVIEAQPAAVRQHPADSSEEASRANGQVEPAPPVDLRRGLTQQLAGAGQ